MPNQVAVNGNLMRKSYIAGGYQERELVDVEALRYLYLNTERENNYNYFTNHLPPVWVPLDVFSLPRPPVSKVSVR